MLKGKYIAVVVPAYNEEEQIGIVIETMPDFVDRIVIINDKSSDETSKVVLDYIKKYAIEKIHIPASSLNLSKKFHNQAELVLQETRKKELEKFVRSEVVNCDPDNDRIILINNLENGGVGASISRGYKWCKDHGIQCTAVMAGDAQMDPDELNSICVPIIEEGIDYVKGNRLIHRSAWLVIPKIRYLGNSILSIFTKVASGYWRISDTQTGYTAISLEALNALRLHEIYPRYGMPNDMLVKLNIAMCTIREIPIKPVYEIGEQSKMKLYKVIPRISFLLFKSFFKRLWIKYLFRDFHPLFLLYNGGLILFLIWIPYLIKILSKIVNGEQTSFETLIAFTFLGVTSFQFMLFAMWMDIQDNERLYK